jgi:hypothetical protein
MLVENLYGTLTVLETDVNNFIGTIEAQGKHVVGIKFLQNNSNQYVAMVMYE